MKKLLLLLLFLISTPAMSQTITNGPLTGLPSCPNQTVLGNISGVATIPTCQSSPTVSGSLTAEGNLHAIFDMMADRNSYSFLGLFTSARDDVCLGVAYQTAPEQAKVFCGMYLGAGLLAANYLYTVPSVSGGANVTIEPNPIGGDTNTAMTISGKGTGAINLTSATVNLPNIIADTGITDNSVCINSAGRLFKGSGTLGICLGTSSARYKDGIIEDTRGLDSVLNLFAKEYRYKPGYGDNGAKIQHGFLAEDVIQVLPELVGSDPDGKPNTVDLVGMIPILITAIQQQQVEISALTAANENTFWHRFIHAVGL